MASRLAFLVLLLSAPADALTLTQSSVSQVDESVKLPAFETTVGGCTCDMQQLECMPTEKCLQALMKESPQRAAEGAAMRKSLKEQSTFAGTLPFSLPVGKSLQYGTVKNFNSWLKNGQISNFDQASELFNEVQSEEDVKTAALKEDSSAIRQKILKGENTADEALLMNAQIMQMMFNRQPVMQDEYEKHVTQIHPGVGEFPVAMHVRRADSCNHAHSAFATAASSLDSAPQMTNQRNCYNTSVYVEKLAQVYDEIKKPLLVYLSTDDTESVMDEIQSAAKPAFLEEEKAATQSASTMSVHRTELMNSVVGELQKQRKDIFENSEFRFLDYPRSNFDYKGMIEGAALNRAFMTGSAISDLYHLSHGQFFIGHLGSRFGKSAYLLAVARHNSAIPYASIDGHNLCCEIDEQCQKANSVMKSMTECLTFAHELGSPADVSNYWTQGSVREGVTSA